MNSRAWRSRKAIAGGAVRAIFSFASVEHSEGNLVSTLNLIRKNKSLIYTHDVSFAELLQWAANRYQFHNFIEYGQQKISFYEMNQRANRLARCLLRTGLSAPQGVAMMMANHPRFLELFFAIQKLGIYAVPVNALLLGEGLAYILNHSEVSAVVMDHTTANKVADIRDQLDKVKHFFVSTTEAEKDFIIPEEMRDYDELNKLSEEENASNLDMEIDSDSTGVLLYTSGTTGRPKAVELPFGHQHLKAINLLANFQYDRSDKLYTCLPLYHQNALTITVGAALWKGIPVYLSKRFSASRFWKEVAECEATHFNTIGGMIPILLKTPLSPYDRSHKVKRVLSAACPKDAWKPFERRFGVDIWEGYGAVDGGGKSIVNIGNGPVGSLGRPSFRYRLVQKDGTDAQGDRSGELWIYIGKHDRSPVRYFKNDKASRDKVKDGWLHTGDIMHRDEKGFLYFIGRNTDSMRRRGENVSAYEVEKQVDTHPDILESAAFAVPSNMGEDDIMVAVVLVEGRTLEPVDFLYFIRKKLPKYAVPRYFEVVDSFPKTGTHRIIKTDLKSRGVTNRTVDLEILANR